MKTNKQIRVKKTLFISIFITLVCLLFIFNPIKDQFFPRCPFLMLTGWQCPGCGSQRAIHCLLHFDLAQAFRFNQLLIISIPYLLLGIYLTYFNKQNKHVQLRKALYGKEAIYLILFIIAIFFLARNLL